MAAGPAAEDRAARQNRRKDGSASLPELICGTAADSFSCGGRGWAASFPVVQMTAASQGAAAGDPAAGGLGYLFRWRRCRMLLVVALNSCPRAISRSGTSRHSASASSFSALATRSSFDRCSPGASVWLIGKRTSQRPLFGQCRHRRSLSMPSRLGSREEKRGGRLQPCPGGADA